MIWVQARRDSAQVVDVQTLGNRSLSLLVVPAVKLHVPPPDSAVRVATGQRTLPNPTRRFVAPILFQVFRCAEGTALVPENESHRMALHMANSAVRARREWGTFTTSAPTQAFTVRVGIGWNGQAGRSRPVPIDEVDGFTFDLTARFPGHVRDGCLLATPALAEATGDRLSFAQGTNLSWAMPPAATTVRGRLCRSRKNIATHGHPSVWSPPDAT